MKREMIITFILGFIGCYWLDVSGISLFGLGEPRGVAWLANVGFGLFSSSIVFIIHKTVRSNG